MSLTERRKLPREARHYDAYRLGRYVEAGCDHAGPYCKCDAPYWLRPLSPIEEARAERMREPVVVEGGE